MASADSEVEPSTADFERIGREMIERAISRAAGQESDYCVGGRPSGRYYVSNLTPDRLKDEEDELFTETKPSTIGLQIRPGADEETLRVGISFDAYVRTMPTPGEYEAEVPDDYDPLSGRLYSKIRVRVRETLSLSADLDEEADRLSERVNEELAETVSDTIEERTVYPVDPPKDVGNVLGRSDVDPGRLSEAEYETLLDELWALPSVDHEWDLEVDVKRRDDEVELRLTNDVPMTTVDEGGSSPSVDYEACLFNPEIRASGELRPYELDVVSEDFRYDRRIWGKGMNCSVGLRDADVDLATGEAADVAVETRAVSRHQTYRFVHRGEEDRYEADIEHLIDVDDGFDTSLEALWQGDLVETLYTISDAMHEYHTEWKGALRRQKRDELTEEELREYDEAAQQFQREIDNFERGIEALEERPDGLRAFRMMNRAFAEQPDRVGIPGWRPFQLVFIVSNLSSILAREYDEYESYRDEEAEVLWFPTGGGKTEAYLGLIVYALFFDRLRGKNRGVTAWIRFTLTLLGSQQLRRFMRVLTFANEVKEDVGLSGERFSIGYYTGSTTTPNRIGGRNTLDSQFEGPNGSVQIS